VDFPIKIAIFNSYVKLPEGNIPIVVFLMVNIGNYTYVESYVCIFLLVNIGIAIVIYV
jgi:hypothetical protein